MAIDWRSVPPESLCRVHVTVPHLLRLLFLIALGVPLLREIVSGWVYRVLGPAGLTAYGGLLALTAAVLVLNVIESHATLQTLFGALRREGEQALARGNLDLARDCFKRALALQREDTACHLGLATALADSGDTTAASELLRHARRKTPRSAAAAALLGSVLRRQGHLDEAERVVQEALALQPDLAEAHVELGHLDVARCDLEHAAEAFRRAAREARPPQMADAAARLLRRVEQRAQASR